jgi:hypothetical protein
METLTQKDKIKAIRELTKEITASKEKAQRYLKDSGIDDYVKRTLKILSQNAYNGKLK